MPRKAPGAKAKRLAKELRVCRESAGLDLTQAAEDVGWDKSKLSRTETGKRNFEPEEVASLLGLYKVTGERRERLLATARTMSEPGWWELGLQGMSADSGTLIDYESEADRITNWSPLMVPGLLQTLDYAKAWMLSYGGLPVSDIELRLTARLRRQQILHGGVAYAAYLGEAALRTDVGGAVTMSRQLGELLSIADRPNVTLRVVPVDSVPNRAQLGAFVVLEFDDWTPVVHIEMARSGVFMDTEGLTEPYMETVNDLAGTALDETESARMVSKIKDEVDRTWKT